MMTHPDEDYFIWLYSQVGVVKLKNPARTHWALLRQLYTIEFVWLIPNDDNRVDDAYDLRGEFLDGYEGREDVDEDWQSLGTSVLEVLIALARRLSFFTDIDPHEWFWELLENIDIGMAHTNDQHYNHNTKMAVDDAVERVIWRTYAPDGRGGLFPLENPHQDQRRVELWYQMSAYLAPDV